MLYRDDGAQLVVHNGQQEAAAEKNGFGRETKVAPDPIVKRPVTLEERVTELEARLDEFEARLEEQPQRRKKT